MVKSKIIAKDAGKLGIGIFASQKIKKGEHIANWKGGKVYKARKWAELPEKVAYHAMQLAKNKWIDKNHVARFVNNSCSPNSYFKDKYDLVAMKNIRKGEEITVDYDLVDYDITDDKNWHLRCRCNSKNCRKILRGYKYLKQEMKEKYLPYTRKWLIIAGD